MPNSPHIHDHDSKCDHNHDSNDVGQRDVVDPNVDVMSPRQAELADRRTVALGSAPFVPYGRNIDRPTVGHRDDAVNVVEASENIYTRRKNTRNYGNYLIFHYRVQTLYHIVCI